MSCSKVRRDPTNIVYIRRVYFDKLPRNHQVMAINHNLVVLSHESLAEGIFFHGRILKVGHIAEVIGDNLAPILLIFTVELYSGDAGQIVGVIGKVHQIISRFTYHIPFGLCHDKAEIFLPLSIDQSKIVPSRSGSALAVKHLDGQIGNGTVSEGIAAELGHIEEHILRIFGRSNGGIMPEDISLIGFQRGHQPE